MNQASLIPISLNLTDRVTKFKASMFFSLKTLNPVFYHSFLYDVACHTSPVIFTNKGLLNDAYV